MKILLPCSLLTTITAWTTPKTTQKRIAALRASLVEFSKYEGLGNDFILIDDRHRSDPSLTPEQSAKLCDRNFSVGGDGVIFALKPPSEDFDFSMRIYNSDGSEPEMCGNGIRCLAQFLADLGEDAVTYNIDTLAGLIIPAMDKKEQQITVDMGEPELVGVKVPCTLEPNFGDDGTVIVEQTIELENGKSFQCSAISMGNPHCIIFVDDLEKDIDFEVDGPLLEKHSAFPAKTNVEFVQVMAPDHLKMKVWERGAGPTLACGTGACALTVAAILADKIPRSGVEGTRVTLPGGDLFIEWREENNKIYMKGPGTFSYKGAAALK